jgi:hypothetical protein
MIQTLVRCSAVLLAFAGSVCHAQTAGRLDSVQASASGGYAVTGSGWPPASTVRVILVCPATNGRQDSVTTATADGHIQANTVSARIRPGLLIKVSATTDGIHFSNYLTTTAP